jgi:acyl-CoA synthetase (AMP-forming)/AMP-acid ligase II
MDYDATDPKAPKGEVLLRGPCMFEGYYKAPDKTAEVGGRSAAGLACAGRRAFKGPGPARALWQEGRV